MKNTEVKRESKETDRAIAAAQAREDGAEVGG